MESVMRSKNDVFIENVIISIKILGFDFQIDSQWVKISQSCGVQLHLDQPKEVSHHGSKTGSMKFGNTRGEQDGHQRLDITHK